MTLSETVALGGQASRLRLAAGEALGSFRLLGLLGRGGMGEVWLAQEERAGVRGRRVALKVLGAAAAVSPESARRFELERELLGRVAHPGVVRPLGSLATDGTSGLAFFPMELVLGKSLADVLAEHGRFPVLEALRVLVEVAGALEAVHAAGIVHRDVKPSNVLLERDGRARLTDFGLARALDQSRFTAPGAAVGTPAYMAPEQAKGETAGPAADLYALGVLAHELIAGQPPFSAENALALLRLHADAKPRPLRELRADVPEPVERLVLRLLEKDEKARGESVASLRRELEDLQRALLPESAAFAAKVAASIERETRPVAALAPETTAPSPATRSTAAAGEVAARPRGRGALGFLAGTGLALALVAALDSGRFGPTGRAREATVDPGSLAALESGSPVSPRSSPAAASPGPVAASPPPRPAGPRAVVRLRDGRSFAGTLVVLSPEGATLRGPDGTERRFGRGELEGIDYETGER